MLRLQGRNVLVTGASSGIGQAIAVRFAQEGANVAINYRSGAELAEITRQMVRVGYMSVGKPERNELVVQADVSNVAQVQEMFRTTIDTFGSLDVLVSNAGI